MKVRISPSLICNNKVICIKAVRSLSALGLKDSKDLIDDAMNNISGVFDITNSDKAKVKEDILILTTQGFKIAILADESNLQAESNMIELLKDMIHDCIDQNLFGLSMDLMKVLEKHKNDYE